MLHRHDEEGLIVVSQPAHAWVAGQLARHWGNGDFPRINEEVCLAAEQHDIGFLSWEQQPTLNRVTGLPYSFLEIPTRLHLELWTDGIQKMMRFGRYPALLVSRHFTALGRRFISGKLPSDAEMIARFLDSQEILQTSLFTSLSNDYYYSEACGEERFRSEQQVVSLLDWLSLQLLLRFREQRLNDLPASPDAGRFKFTPLNQSDTEIGMHPWPFAHESISLACDGNRLLQTFDDEQRMREALRAAAPITIAIRLVRIDLDEHADCQS